jgi:peptidylprolyl isomerase
MGLVNKGDVVRVHYTGRAAGGAVIATSEGKAPVEFLAGGDETVPGVSFGVLGMVVGERKTVTVLPHQGFGERNEDLLQRVPLASLPPGVTAGETLTTEDEFGARQFWVVEVGDGEAVLDSNHPLAGQTLEFDIELVSVQAG